MLRNGLQSVGGKPLQHPGPVHQLTISPDSRWLLTVADNANAPTWPVRFDDLTTPAEYGRIAYLWDLAAKDPAEALTVLGGHKGGVGFAAFSPDSRWAITTGTFLEKEVSKKEDNGSFRRVSEPVVGTGDNTPRLWNLTANQPGTAVTVLRGHEREIQSIAFSPDSRWVVTGSGDETARLWSLAAKDPSGGVVVLRGHEGPVRNLRISPDSRWLVTGSETTARLWDLRVPNPGATPIVMHPRVGFSPDFRWLALQSETPSSGGLSRGLSLFNLTSQNPAAQSIFLPGYPLPSRGFSHDRPSPFRRSGISPDSRWLVTSETKWDGKGPFQHTVRLWDLKSADPAKAPFVLQSKKRKRPSPSATTTTGWLLSPGGGTCGT